MTIFARGNRLYAKTKAIDGTWKQLATGCAVGEEAKARLWLDALERKVAAARAAGATNGPLTVSFYSKGWIKERQRLGLDWKNDEQRLRTHVLPAIGAMPLADVRPRHLVEVFQRLRVAGTIAQRTIYNIYSVVSALFRDARLADLIEQSPCILTVHQLGPLADKDPTQRGDAVFTRGEVARLIGDARIPADRHVVYALGALAGLRHGESAGLRWHHYDATKEPLGQLTIATSYDKGRTKTGVVRRVPAHPILAAMLAEWRLSGWAAVFGRQPEPEDLIVPLPPTRRGSRRAPIRARAACAPRRTPGNAGTPTSRCLSCATAVATT
jgi:integrase